jgi:two-component system NtrC family sensor kinase
MHIPSFHRRNFIMKFSLLTFSFFLKVIFIAAQQSKIDSLQHEAATTQNDTLKLILLGKLSNIYTEINPDTAYHYSEKMLSLARKLDFQLEEAHALAEMGYALLNMGNYPRSLQTFLSGLSIADDPKSELNIIPARFQPTDEFTNRTVTPHMQRLDRLDRVHQYLGILYGNANNYEKALSHFLLARQLAEQSGNLHMLTIINGTLGRTYLALKKPDSALSTEKKAYDVAMQAGYERYLGSILLNLGRAYLAKGDNQKAGEYFRKAIAASTEQNYFRGIVAGNLALADIYKQSGQRDSGLYYIENALPVAKYLNAPDLLLRSYTALADYYKAHNNSDSAVKYQSFIIKINDSLFNSKQAQQFQNIDFDEQQRQQQIETAKSAYRNKLRIYVLLTGIGIFLLLAIILWRNNLHKQKAYALLKKQKHETDKQKTKVEHTLIELKTTQAQLIQ